MSPDVPQRAGRGADLLRAHLRRSRQEVPREAAITPVPRDGALPLSFAQRRLWVLDQFRGGAEYLVPLVFRLRGDLSGLDIGGALDELVRRHEILRTRYTTDADGEPVQRIDPPSGVELAFDDLGGAGPAELDALLAADTTRPFDLAEGPILRARLIRLTPVEHVLAIVFHHIAVDGWSGSLLARELAALCVGEKLPAPTLQYADFAAWQRAEATGGRLDSALEYWVRHLRDLPALELPADRLRPPVWEPDGATVTFDVPAELGRAAAALAGAHQATPFMVYLAVFWSLLHRYTGQDDFAVGTPIAGRTHADAHGLIGLFVNTIALRADLRGDPAFAELLDRARHTAIDAYAHQDVPFERVVDALVVDRDLATHPLVNVNFILQNNEPFRFEAGAVSGELMPIESRQAKFDLSWTLEERPDGSLSGEVTFPHALLDTATARRMAEHYLRLLAAATAEPDRRIGELPLLGPAELGRLVRRPAGTAPAAPCLHERFARQARRRPDAVALTFEGRHLTYGELDARANRLAHRLVAAGVGAEDLVGVCLSRGIDLVVSLLAVLKAGAAYLPLDPEYPAERLEFLVRDAAARVVVTEAGPAARVRAVAPAGEVIVLDEPEEAGRIAAGPATAPSVMTHPDNLAYVIYTSGSTGRPKGVQVTHANVVRLLTATEDDYRFGPEDVWALFHSYAFDVSVWEIWGTFLYGGRLVVLSQEVTRSPWELATLLADEGVTVLNQTPSAFRNLIELVGSAGSVLDRLRLRLVVLAGEALDVGAFRPWWERFGDTAPRIVNMYGITETTVHVTYRPLGIPDLAGDRSPIGPPMRDLTMYVLDERMRPVPVGVPGEIYVGGPGVTRGYLGRPGLTAQRYVPDPFGAPGARLYRSGDKARVLAGGEIGFLGRFDDQVKIRGFRVELGEVESCLAEHPGVEAAVVTVDEPAPGDRRLVGYVVSKDAATVPVSELRAHVAERLPGYLVPSIFMNVPKLPLTVNGKVDRRALPAPGGSRLDQEVPEYVAPGNTREETIAGIFAEVLGLPRVGMRDNFFASGGDSILAVRLVGKLRASGFHYSVQDIFRHQSIAELRGAHAGEAAGTGEHGGTRPFALLSAEDRAKVPAGVLDAYPMGRMQTGMVYEMLADPERNNYHNVTSYLIREDGTFDAAAVAAAADAVVANHEILRTSFDLSSFTEPVQLVHVAAKAEFGHEDLRRSSAEEQRQWMDEFRTRQREQVFDLGTAPLIRFHAHQVGDDRWFLSLTECHAILDGWSHNSVVTELLDSYRAIRDGRPPRPGAVPSVRFADFIAQEQRSLRDGADRQFWAERLEGAARLLIPAEWADPAGPADYHLRVPYRDLEAGLRKLAELAGASLKSVLLAAHLAVWRVVAGEEPFYSGLVCNGRTEAEGGDQVRGMFLNTVPFVAPAGAGTWRELVAAVFDEEVALWPHRRFPLPELQREFAAGSRLVDVEFNFLNFHVLDREAVDTAGSTDVSLNEVPLCTLTEAGDLVIVAKSAWIGRRHAELLARMYRRALELMATDPGGSRRVPLLPSDERDRLLAERDADRVPVPARGVHELVAEHAARTPDAPAVAGAGGELTYRELWDRAQAWAAALREAGVRAGDLVGLALPQKPELVAAVLGVLSAGAAYVPMDPGHPAERVTGTLRAAGVRVLITTAAIAGRLDSASLVTITGAPAVPAGTAAAVHHPPQDELVYVVHTSGSTGRPKGVMIPHGALTDRVCALRRDLELTERDVIVTVMPAVVDVWQLDVFTALTAGGLLVLAGDDFARDPLALAELLRGREATLMIATPTTWRMLAGAGWTPPASLRRISGGEATDADLMRWLCAGGAKVWDMYGPTEVTVYSFNTRHFGDDTPPYRFSAANTTNYLLDDDLNPVPAGVPGQLFVGGGGLARGYLGQPGITAGVFLPDPFTPVPGGRMYATGDIGRLDRHGRIEILGRRDHQLKIRGFRVELGEIENTIAAHPGVRGAVVHPVTGPREVKRLAAYVILRDATTSMGELNQHVSRHLPGHMVPAHFVAMEAFPRLPNGKVDRDALPDPGQVRPEVGTRYVPPRGRTEEAIAAVWAVELGLERVGGNDDFYALGGHSLLTLRIVAQLSREHGIELTFRDFLTHRTVRGLAGVAALDPESRARPPSLVWLGRDGEGAPLFCVHPGGGSAHWYRGLADAYAGRRPLAAFEWPGLHDETAVAGSLAEVARSYVAELRAERPAGPYHVLGWCGSSGIAWEMARYLRELGERVRLILIDPIEYPSAGNSPLAENVRVLRRAEGLLASLPGQDGTERAEVRAELVDVLRKVVDDGDSLFDEEGLDEGWASRLRSWREIAELRLHYRFPRYAGSVDVVVCAELVAGGYADIFGSSFDAYLDQWRQLAEDGVRVSEVPGDHRTALFPPHVFELAAVLDEIIDR
ncbi:non-ribosomal peptide synthetase [Amycolatopsis sp. YIM 10]|uniref:non-ribosomal peptide synthetase n=1 Tax=Amycolatopsis sp. YIM 10 TaxID=2653857 RepID=UPI00128FF0AF|nr:non-ribosomal peptide synthetase [Amycolatopsis sp. YIM 10]QFU89756.1 Tyrocidine synthase 3 [Amycolatopsis sp. YIM 10]